MKDTLLVRGLVVLVLVVGIVFLLKSKSDVSQTAENTVTPTPTSAQMHSTNPTPSPATIKTTAVAGMKTSLGGIFNETGNYQCDYESVSQQTRTSNVVYISNGRMRGEFRTIEPLVTKSNIVVYDGNYLYTWTEGKATGTVTQPKTLKDLPGIIPEDVSSGKILGSNMSNVSWNCHAWSKDASKLVKPSYVTFY